MSKRESSLTALARRQARPLPADRTHRPERANDEADNLTIELLEERLAPGRAGGSSRSAGWGC